jgi:stage V sporulation protein B
VLTGMAMPMIFFPNALTGSIAVLLLPVISESYALGDMKAVKKTIKRTITYCSLMGLVCMTGFLLLGRWLGTVLFNSEMAGHFIITLSFICPFMYLDTTLSSILQGLDMTVKLFIMNVICLVIRLGFIFLTVPKVGITGYLWGILVSQIVLTAMYLLCLYLYRAKRRKTISGIRR